MRIKVFIIVIFSLFFFNINWYSLSHCTNIKFNEQIELRNNAEALITDIDNYFSPGKTLICLGNYLTDFQPQGELPNLKEHIQDRIDHQRNNSWQYNSILIYTYIVLIIIGLVFVSFRIIDTKNKHLLVLSQNEIRDQIIKELKIDHQLLASRAILIGEEKERGRISRDLHDGLGGMLSGVKLSLSSIKNANLNPEEINEKIDRAVSQLNASISELRMIAQNLMPESLVNFGLKDALNDLCSNLGIHKNINISFLFYGESFRLDNSIETSLFRIAQEAINNAIKYARASEIIVQLIQDESWLNMTIQDNGQGFDIEKIQEKNSGGLRNIRARAESFDGRVHIESKPGIGTEIIVDFIYNSVL
jgi:signal transduction histidine kinase